MSDKKIGSANVPLVRAQVKTAMERMAPAMTPVIRQLAASLIDLLEDDGSVLTNQALAALFPLANQTEAESQFKRLLQAIDRASEESGFQVRAEIAGSLETDQRVRFSPSRPNLLEDAEGLRAIGASQLIVGQAGEVLPEERTVVIFTFNEHEHAAVNNGFIAGKLATTRSEAGITVEELGVHAGLTVLHYYSRQNNRQSQRSVSDVLATFKPMVVIATGIAFGIDSSTQSLGDVLVSSYVCDYEVSKVQASGRIVLRGARPPASKGLVDSLRLIDRRNCMGGDAAQWPKLHFGGLLSGEKLVDNLSFRDSLTDIAAMGDIVGGEMESAGLFAAVEGRPVEWIVIKAICDWGDGGKAVDKKRRQRDAAFNSAWVVKCLIEHGMTRASGNSGSSGGMHTHEIRTSHTFRPQSMCPFLDQFAGTESPITEGQGGRPADLETIADNPLRAEGPNVVAYDDIMSWLDDPEGRPLYALLGEYGMGKTTTCQRIAKHLRVLRESGSDAPQPLYFDLRKVERLAAAGQGFAGTIPSLAETIEDCLRLGYIHENGVVPKYRDVLLAISDGALAIFDGLDEVLARLTESQGLGFTSNLLRIFSEADAFCESEELPSPTGKNRLRVLISCRTQFFRNLAEQHNHLTGEHRGAYSAQRYRALVLLPFDDDQIARYLSAVFPEANVSSLMDRISEVHNLRELSGRPFSLKLVARFIPQLEQWRSQGKRVTGATLYREVAREWLIRDKEKQSFQPQEKERLAGDFAVHLWRNRIQGLTAVELENWLGEWLAKQSPLADFQRRPRDLLQEDLRNATFLKRVDSNFGSGMFMFAHSSLQEFFLADALARALTEGSHDARTTWALPPLSAETLEFLGQMLDERASAQDAPEIQAFDSWKRPYMHLASERQLDYAMYAERSGHVGPSISGMDLRGADLTGYIFISRQRAGEQAGLLDFSNAVLDGTLLRRAKFEAVDLTRCSFRGADLTQAEISGCDARSVEWCDSVLFGTMFRNNAFGPFVPRRWERVALTVSRWINNKGGPSVNHPEIENRELAIRGARSGSVSLCRYSRDARHLLSITGQGEVSVWRPNDGAMLTAFFVSDSVPGAAAISNSGYWVVVADADGGLCLWDTRTRQPVGRLLPQGTQVVSCSFSCDDSFIVVGCRDHSIRKVSIPDAQVVCVIRIESGMQDSTLLANDEQVVVACSDGLIRIWSLLTAKLVGEIEQPVGQFQRVDAARYSSLFASTSSAGRLQVWEPESEDCAFAKMPHSHGLVDCVMSPDGSFVASVPDSGAIRIWKTGEGAGICSLPSTKGGQDSCDFGSTNDEIAAAAVDGSVRIFKSDGSEFMRLAYEAAASDHIPRLAAAGDFLLSIVDEHAVRVCDILTMKPIGTLLGHTDVVLAVAIDARGAIAATASADMTLRVWQLTSGKCVRTLRIEWAVSHCAFLGDASSLIATSPTGLVSVWDLNAEVGQELITSRAFKRRGTSVVSSCGSWIGFSGIAQESAARGHSPERLEILGTVLSPSVTPVSSKLFDGAICARKTGSKLRLHDLPKGRFECISFSRDGRLVAVACDGLFLWDIRSGTRQWAEYSGSMLASSIAFSPDNRFIVVGSKDRSLAVRDALTGRLVASLVGHAAPVTDCFVTEDGRWIVSSSLDRTVRYWAMGTWESTHVLLVTRRGAAEWTAANSQVLHAAGDAWRHLDWRGTSKAGQLEALPLETFVNVKTWSDDYSIRSVQTG